MITDYKVVEEREVDGVIYQKVRFYEGSEETFDQYNPITKTVESVTEYRRTSMYEEVTYEYEAV